MADTLTQEQKITLAKSLGWKVMSRWVDDWGEYDDLLTPDNDFCGGDDVTADIYESAKTEEEAWARLPYGFERDGYWDSFGFWQPSEDFKYNTYD